MPDRDESRDGADRVLDRSRDRPAGVPLGLSRHGIPGVRRQVAASEGARFGRMFPGPR
jgi:hypothetical protein